MCRMKTRTFQTKGTAYARPLKQKRPCRWRCLGKSKKGGVVRIKSVEAGFAPHRIPSTKPGALDRAAGSEAGKAGRG